MTPAPGGGASRWRGPVTWVSAVATIGGLYSLYQYQYQKQLNRQKSIGKPELGGPFTLKDVDGKAVSNTDLVGEWVLIYFGFTKCPDICPEEMAKASGLIPAPIYHPGPNANLKPAICLEAGQGTWRQDPDPEHCRNPIPALIYTPQPEG